MGLVRHPHKVNLIVGLLSKDTAALARAKASLERIFGRVELEGPLLDFTHTDYYKEEMGSPLKRQFLSFERLCGLKGICGAKVRTNRLERRLSRGSKRTVNIDPGYLDLAKLVLFSTKDYSHRMYLDKGIFAETTLFYKGGTFNPWPWTYPDYATAAYIGFFNKVREIYKAKIAC
jgi:hypothetical protein